ncbi:glycosyltransferase family 2 protein [Microbacterium sp. CFBP9034]|uniref:glycosyltransferase family 2 protein n=1 Tax=Microbacterium sp. CFBP9034 TaxID=3096540 RepID=UPI002A6B3665|nr:glycosyltransferase family 2 protein [Microbacterium sp. CFBP9034]MDY0908984.1 glycosyltransferase family 2 protein [Microbacterium sp. CFBP9034]
MTDASVAIVVRTKDRPDFLVRALASITGQTLGTWECVIVNDGGAAEPVDAAIAALPAEARDRFRVLHAPVSRGRWVSANAGVLATSAPLLVLHDDDDSWHPEFLERSVGYLADHPDRRGVVSRIEILWEERTRSGLEVVRREVFQPQLPAPTLSDTLLFNRFVPIAFVYRRSLHEELGLYDESLPVVGDWAFNLKVLARYALDYLGDEPLAYWHQRVGVAGADGNSVIESRGTHALYDARIRDAALRDYADENGLGLLLYLTRFIDTRFVEVENGIRAEIVANSLWRRIGRRLHTDRLRRAGGRGSAT